MQASDIASVILGVCLIVIAFMANANMSRKLDTKSAGRILRLGLTGIGITIILIGLQASFVPSWPGWLALIPAIAGGSLVVNSAFRSIARPVKTER